MAFAEEQSELWSLAESIDSSLSHYQNSHLEMFKFLNRAGECVNERAEPTGSCVEGTKVNTPNDRGDVDGLLISGKVCLEEDLFDYVQDYPAFLHIRYEGNHRNYFDESNVAENGYILADVLRNMTGKHFLLNRLFTEVVNMPSQDEELFSYSHPSAVGMECRTVKLSKHPLSKRYIKEVEKFDKQEALRFLMEKASYLFTQTTDKGFLAIGDWLKTNTQWMNQYFDKAANVTKYLENEIIDGTVLVRSADFVPAYSVRLGTWPRVAQDWIYRQRRWPSQEAVNAILEAGCHVVAKPLPHLARNGKFIGDGPDVYFRLSFSVSEVILAKNMNEVQRTCWKILKAYQKGFLETSPRILTSYHWKNIMFWLCESEEESFWVAPNLEAAVKKAIAMMQQWMSIKFLPQYFCDTMNLFCDHDDESMEKVKTRLGDIYDDPLFFLNNFLYNPPEAQECSLDTAEIGVGCRNKVVETGHETMWRMYEHMVDEQDDEKLVDSFKGVGTLAADFASYFLVEEATSSKTKHLIKETTSVAKNFIEGAAKPPTMFKNDQEMCANFTKEVKNLGIGLLNVLVSNASIEND